MMDNFYKFINIIYYYNFKMSLSKYSSDQTFWNPVQVPKISTVKQCFSADGQIVDRRIVKHLPASIRDFLIGANRIGASGNGFCFLNACLALLCLICPEYANFPYEMFLNPYKDYLHQVGEENVHNPNTLDTDKASKAFRFLIMIQFGITNISFLVLYPDDGSYKFSPELGPDGKANPYTNHLFVLVLQSGHFTAVSIDESVQNILYCVLLEEEKKDNTLRVSSEPSSSSATSIYSFDGAAKGPTEASLSDIKAMFNSLY
jgi:hypothetical protein